MTGSKSNILIIGSTGRNTGKTEFACRIIEKHATQKEIVAVKIIPVDKNEVECHRGLEGCGLCNSLTGDYKIIEETTTDSLKDTSRMLKAGANKAYLLLVDRKSLEKGIRALLGLLPDNVMVVIESNSVRKVLAPGLFIVIKDFTTNSVKQTCAEVMELADKLVGFDNMKWDFPPDNVKIQSERWIIQESG
ncbi:MAG: hypothetical protein D4R67_07395 [Bacteroidetes bacterium]|nr:MAG: hypothetical protein D4R67_07395 [Bacteroidota bacterium]